MQTVWRIFSEQLTFANWGYGAEIHAFTLMNNHFHLLISTPDANLDEIMAFFMRETTRSLNKAAGVINQSYGGPHFRCLVETPLYYLHCYKYIYANPVMAGMVKRVEEYTCSSLHFLLGQSLASFPVAEDITLFSDVEGTLQWLNKRPSDESWESIRNAISRSRFRLAKINYGRNQNPLEKAKL
jgi:REP element-mobilizing transposase RayT